MIQKITAYQTSDGEFLEAVKKNMEMHGKSEVIEQQLKLEE